MRVVGLCGAVVAAIAVAFFMKQEESAPIEYGNVDWRRGFSEALDAAKKRDRPLLVLFQEVPG